MRPDQTWGDNQALELPLSRTFTNSANSLLVDVVNSDRKRLKSARRVSEPSSSTSKLEPPSHSECGPRTLQHATGLWRVVAYVDGIHVAVMNFAHPLTEIPFEATQ